MIALILSEEQVKDAVQKKKQKTNKQGGLCLCQLGTVDLEKLCVQKTT